MKKNYLILLCMFFGCIIMMKAQGTGSAISIPQGASIIYNNGTNRLLPENTWGSGATVSIGTNYGTITNTGAGWGYGPTGLLLTAGNISVSGYNHIAFDLFIPASANTYQVQLTLVHGGSNTEKYYNTGDVSGGTWQRFEISIEDLALTGDNITRIYLQIPSTTTYPAVYCFDNIYLYKVTDPEPATGVGFNESSYHDVVYNGSINSSTVTNQLFGGYLPEFIAPFTLKDGNITVKSKWSGYTSWNSALGWELNTAMAPNKHSRLCFDIWPSQAIAAGDYQLRLYNSAGTGSTTAEYNVNALTAETWNRVYIDIKDVDLSEIKMVYLLCMNTAVNGTIAYMDNVYFYTPDLPNTAPTWATHDANTVIPIYGQYTSGTVGDTYASTVNQTTSWTSAMGVSDFTGVSGNYSKKIIFAGNAVINMNSPVSVTTSSGESANVLRFNVWTNPGTPPTLSVRVNAGTLYTVNSASLRAGQWNTVEIPLSKLGNPATIRSITLSGSGTVYIDNLFVYYSTGNTASVARVGSDEYLTIKAAYEANLNKTGDIIIELIDDSKEPETIEIAAGNSAFTNLIIRPSGNVRTITYTGEKNAENHLFKISGTFTGNRTVTIDGRLNGSGTAGDYLVLQQGKANPAGIDPYNSSLILLTGTSNVTMQYCKFKGISADIRPEFTIMGRYAVNNVNILNNNFEDCLYLGGTPGSYEVSVVQYSDEAATHSWKINNNHFYETSTAAVSFTGSVGRRFIFYSTTGLDYTVASPLEISNNKIGGNSRNASGDIEGTMLYNSPSGKGSDMWGICTKLGWLTDANANANNYVLIENNEVAHIAVNNSAKANSGIAIFEGLTANGGSQKVSTNRIHDLSNISLQNTTDSGDEPLFLVGIRCEGMGYNDRFICEDNHIYNFTADFTGSRSSFLILGIMAQLAANNQGNTVNLKGAVRNNRVVLGLGKMTGNFNTETAGGFAGITARCFQGASTSSSNHTLQLDVYNNISVLTDMNAPLKYICLFELRTNNVSTNHMNCFNNISYLQPAASNSFADMKSTAELAGIRVEDSLGENSSLNIFHNTVLIKDLNKADFMSNGARLMSEGKTKFFNNNIINLHPSGFVLHEELKFINSSADTYLDYNNYYSPKSKPFWYNGDIGDFDYRKFTAYYHEKKTEKDYHSLFMNPEFVSTADIPLTPEGVEVLKSNLKPARFLAGCKVSDTDLAALLNLPGLSGQVSNDASNLDFGMSPTPRRPYLPTIGAINTGFTNYWVGGTSTAWNVTGNWADNTIPATDRDIVFAPDPDDTNGAAFVGKTVVRDLIMSENQTVNNIYNDGRQHLLLNGQTLTITGHVLQEPYEGRSAYAKINAQTTGSKVVYNGNTTSNPAGAATQHIFENTYAGNQIYNLEIANKSDYFVLLHGSESVKPTLEITNRLTNTNTNSNTEVGKHIGGLNCVWHPTTLTLSGPASANITTDYQRIPRNVIFNDSVYNVTFNSTKTVSEHDYLYIKNALTVNAGKAFEIAASKFVKVDGTTTNNGGNVGLIIKSRLADNTAEMALDTDIFPTLPRPNATFIYRSNTQGQAEVNATVEMYSPASLYASEQESSSGIKYQNAWQYFTPAVRSAAVSGFSGGTVYQYNPKGDNTGAYTYGSPYWTGASTTDITKGYTITQNAPKVYSMTGALPNTTFTVPAADLTYYVFNPTNDPEISRIWPDDDATNQGQFLIGNPFTHAISIKDLTFPTNFEKTVYIFNTGSFIDKYDAGGGSTGYFGDQPGENIVIPINQAGQMVGGKILPTSIPSMQGFTIKFLDGTYTHGTAAGGVFSSQYITDKTNPLTDGRNNDIQRSVKLEKDTCTLYIQLKNGDYYDEMLLMGYEGTKKGFDNGWDGKKELNKARALSLFTIEQEEDMTTSYYQISTMDDLDKTNLGIIIGDNEELQSKMDSKHELVLSGNNLDKFYYKIYLEDLKTGTLTDLLDGEVSYFFETETAGEIENRFRIVTVPQEITDVDHDTVSNDNIEIYNLDKTIIINSSKELSGTVSLYDLTGRCVLTQDMDGNRQVSIKTDLNTGAYIVRISSDSGLVNKTIILK